MVSANDSWTNASAPTIPATCSGRSSRPVSAPEATGGADSTVVVGVLVVDGVGGGAAVSDPDFVVNVTAMTAAAPTMATAPSTAAISQPRRRLDGGVKEGGP